MMWFLIFMAISLTASEKLDRTYLPPPGAQFAGGNPEDIQAPFEASNILQPVNLPVVPTVNRFHKFGTTGQPPQTTPVTTTSYAFTQTTTYPSVESYETTALPINPITGLPVLGQNGQQQYGINLPGLIQSHSNGVPSYGTNTQPGSFNQFANQIITPGGVTHIPNSVSPGSDQSFLQHGQPNSQLINQYPGQNLIDSGTPVVIPGSTSLVPGNNQGSIQYPSETNTPTDQFSEIAYQGVPLGQVSQGIYSKQPIIVPDAKLPQYNQDYQNEGQPILDQSSENQNKVGPGSIIGKNIYNPTYHHDGILSTAPGFPSSVSAHSSLNDNIINRPERPQAAADRNAVIINYENVRTTNGYSYSYDTSNGIHADETGIVDDGTRAQGSYSYIGDDGKVYSVTYTADENGFQPHGDHLPTPPPIPEAIQKVIEQAARDEVAGIIDDGSYDEVKYGHDQYQRTKSHRNPQIKDRNSLDNNNNIEPQRKTVKPIAGISEDDHYEDEPHDHLISDIANIKNIPAEKHVTGHSNNHIPNNQIGIISDGNRKNIDNEDNSRATGPNDLEENNFGLKKQGTFAQSPGTNINNLSNSGDYTFNDRNVEPKAGHLPTRRPILPYRVESASQIGTVYPGSQIKDIKESDIYPNNEKELLSENDDEFNQFEQSRPSYSSDSGFPPLSNRRKNMKQGPKGREPEISSKKYSKNKRPQSDKIFDNGNDDGFGKIQKDDFFITDKDQNNLNQLPASQENIQPVNNNGYHYNSPQNQFPTRFNARPLDKSTTLRPFVTSEVHNQPSDIRRTGNRPNYNTQPFMTSSVTTKKGPYTDYDDGDDYDIDQDIDENSTTRKPNDDTLFGQRIRVDQKEPVLPGQKIEYSVTPSYRHSTTTPIPPQNTRFGSSKIREKPMQSPSISIAPASSTSSFEPEFKTSDLYQAKPEPRPVSGYPDSTALGLANEARPSYGSRIPTGLRGSTLHSYPLTSTTITPVTIPASGYSDTTSTPVSVPSYVSRIPSEQRVTTIIPTTLGYQTSLGPMISSGTPQTIQQPTGTDNRNRYQYTTTARPQIPETLDTKTFFPGVSRPQTLPDRQGTLHGPGTTVSAPVAAYQTGYQYEPPKIVSNDGSLINTEPLGSYVSQTSPSDYDYGTPESVYTTTLSPSTIGTTPTLLIPSSKPGRLSQTYPTIKRPGYSSTRNIYDQTPLVDGFGRPITSEPQTRFSSPGRDQRPGIFVTDGEDRRTSDGLNNEPISQGGIPIENVGSVYGVEPSPKYPGYHDQSKIIGEDFTGPKQPQRFDHQTGYHYKK